MGKIAEKVKFIDMYASLPALSFGKDGKVYSRLGLLLTLITIVIIGGMAIFIGVSVFGRQKPSFIQYDLPAKEWNPKLKWNTDDFKFGLGIDRTDVDQDKLITYYPSFSASWDAGQDSELTKRKYKFDLFPWAELYCFDQSENSKGETYLDVKGDWIFEISLGYCDNTIPNNCDSDMEEKLKYSDAIFVYDDLLIDPFNYENPMTTTQSSESQMVKAGVGTTLFVELNEVEFISDNGWIFKDLKTETKLKATTSIKITNQDMLMVKLTYGGVKTVYKRTYPKIPDFFAQISGFITIITPIFFLLVSPYGNLQAIQHMTNELYEIKLNKPNNNNSQDSPQKPAAAKKKRRPSKSKALFSKNDSLKSPRETEGDLVPKKATSKKRASSPLKHSKSIPFSPHAALVIGGLGKLPAKEDTPPQVAEETAQIAEENIRPLRFGSFEKAPSSPFKSNSTNERNIDPQKIPLERAETCPPESEDEQLNENLQPIETKEGENQSPAQDSETEEEEEEVSLRTSDPLEVPWQAWLKSFWRPNPEVQVLKKAQEHLTEAFDLVTLAKKVIEIDKLKACLLTHDQRVLFENLPSSVIVLNPDIDIKSPEAIKQYHWKDYFKGDEIAVRKAYSRLRGTKNQLDQLLIKLYKNEYIDDGAYL